MRRVKSVRNATLCFIILMIPALCIGGKPGGKPGDKVDVPEEPYTAEETPDYKLRDVVHYTYQEGDLRVMMEFENGLYYADVEELHIENCSYVYYDRFGEVESRGKSRRATLYEDDSYLEAEDDVVVISEVNGTKLETDYLEWYGTRDQFVTESFVTVTRTNGDILQGIGMTADVALNYVTIKKDVRGSVRNE